jgi:Flp pilus assembly protein TadG
MMRCSKAAGAGLQRRRRGTVSLELAILAVPFFIMLLGILEISYDFFVQAALDSAVETVARTVQVGGFQGTGTSNSQSIVNAVCGELSAMLACKQMTVSVTPVASGHDYYSASVHACVSSSNPGAAGVNTGTGGQLMVLGAWYNGPTFLGALVPGFATSNGSGGLGHRSFASAGFVNEYFGAGESGATGC